MAEVYTPWSPSHEDCVNNNVHPVIICVDQHVDSESSIFSSLNLNTNILVVFG